jgi:hypothetical protein
MINLSQIISERYDFHSALSKVCLPSVLGYGSSDGRSQDELGF